MIIAGRYGSVDEMGVSYTEKEYDHAVGKGITVLAFIHNDVTSLPTAKVDTDPDMSQRLALFKERVSQKRLVSFWSNRGQLKSNIIIISFQGHRRETRYRMGPREHCSSRRYFVAA